MEEREITLNDIYKLLVKIQVDINDTNQRICGVEGAVKSLASELDSLKNTMNKRFDQIEKSLDTLGDKLFEVNERLEKVEQGKIAT